MGTILTKAYKGIQYLGKHYTAIMKSLLLKWIPLQAPLKKISNFSNNYMIVHIFSGCFSYFTFYMLRGNYLKALSFIGKVPQGLPVKKFRKCLKKLLNGCFSLVLCCVSVMLVLVVKFYQEIFYKSCFSNTSRRLLLKLPRNNQSFLIQLKVSKHYCISFYRIFSNFLCILLLPSVLTFVVRFSPYFSQLKCK